MTFVFNASPLIVLAKAGLLERILELPQGGLIPNAVACEVRNCDDPAVDAVVDAGLFVAERHIQASRVKAGEW
jgi:hypothetical protein